MLTVSDLHVSYGAISALRGISFSIPQGSIVTLIGGNGAGKTTTLRTVSGLLRAKSGTVTFLGENITALPPHKIVARGLCHVPEGRMIFSNLTVDENLSMGAYLQTDAALIAKNRAYVFSIFPRLKERLKQTAGTLSGGEQQMLAMLLSQAARISTHLGAAPTGSPLTQAAVMQCRDDLAVIRQVVMQVLRREP